MIPPVPANPRDAWAGSPAWRRNPPPIPHKRVFVATRNG
jgi:hypothetical protein